MEISSYCRLWRWQGEAASPLCVLGAAPTQQFAEDVPLDGWHLGCALTLTGKEFGVEPGENNPSFVVVINMAVRLRHRIRSD